MLREPMSRWEKSILECMLKSMDAFLSVEDRLSEEDFSPGVLRSIYLGIKFVATNYNIIDFNLVSDFVKKDMKYKTDQAHVELYEILNGASAVGSINIYVDNLKFLLAEQETKKIAVRIKEEGMDYLPEAIESLSNLMCKKESTSALISDIFKDVYSGLLDRCENPGRLRGLSFGYPLLDEITGGLRKKDMIVLAARTSVGKTILSLNVVENVAKLPDVDGAVAVFSLEMSKETLVERLIMSHFKIDSKHFDNGMLTEDEHKSFPKGIESFSKMKVVIDDESGLTIEQINLRCKKIKQKHGLSLVVVDYISLMESMKEAENETIKVSKASQGLRKLAKTFDVPVIVVSQLNRGVDDRQDKHPVLSDLRQSGCIEQDADVVILLYQDDLYNKQSLNPGILEVNVAKNRKGPIGTICLKSDKQFMYFENHYEPLNLPPLKELKHSKSREGQ